MSAQLADHRAEDETLAHAVAIEIVVPVHNEQAALGPCVERLVAHLSSLPWSARVSIADNASTDDTQSVGRALAAEHPGVGYTRMERKGRGFALKHAWSRSRAAVLVYMDVDLSTDLNALLPLVAPLLSGHSDLAIGTRLARGSHTVRGPKREVVSRSYNLLLRGTLGARFSDAQCGFKAIRADVAAALVPLVQDDAWFFDTELLVLAQRAGLRIHEVPVDWVDDPDSRVDIARTAIDDLRGIGRLGIALLRGRVPLETIRSGLGRTSSLASTGRVRSQLAIFVGIGLVSTLAYGVLYLAFRHAVGAQTANALALVGTAVANTAANRRFTFGHRGSRDRLRHHLQGLAVFALGWAVTAGTLWALDPSATSSGSRILEVLALTAANLIVTLGRFMAMRWWIFARR